MPAPGRGTSLQKELWVPFPEGSRTAIWEAQLWVSIHSALALNTQTPLWWQGVFQQDFQTSALQVTLKSSAGGSQ